MLNSLKLSFKEWNFTNINGECRSEIIPFYISVGAKIENRCEDDFTYLSNSFYIDL